MPSRSAPRIVMVSGHAPPTMDGVGDCTAMLVRALARQRPDWRWFWVCKRPRWYQNPISRLSGTRVPILRPNHAWDGPGKALAVAAVRLLRPDVLHIQDQIHSFHESDAAPHLAASTSAAVVTTLHEYHVELPSVRHTNELVRRSRVVIANDPRNAQRCLAQTGRPPDHLWWSGNSVPPADPSWGVRPSSGPLVTFGFLNGKDLDAVHGALTLLRLRHPETEIRWRVVGPFFPESRPAHADLLARLSAGADADWVEFTGGFQVEDRRLRTILAEGRAMLLPFADGASLRRSTLHAAWAAGMPVVTTPPDAPEPAIVDGVNCLLVREPTPEAWAETVGRLLADPALAARLRLGSLAAADRFGADRLARLHITMYEEILSTRDNPRR